MLTTIITLIAVVAVLCFAWWAVMKLAAAFGLPAEIVVILQIIIIGAALVYLLTRYTNIA